MNRILAPFNVAALIFLVIVIMFIRSAREQDRRDAYIPETTEYLTNLYNNRHGMVDEIKRYMPKCIDFDNMALRLNSTDIQIDESGNITLYCSFDDDFAPRIIFNPEGRDRMSQYDTYDYDLVKMLNVTFAPELVDYLAGCRKSIRLVTLHKGKIFEDWTAPPENIIHGYKHDWYEGRLKYWIEQDLQPPTVARAQ